MKAIVYHGPGKRVWEDVPDATIIDPTDAVVKVETTTICGTDCTSSRATSPPSRTDASSATRASAS